MPDEIEQLKKEVEELKKWKRQLENVTTIPLNIDQAFRARLVADFAVSTKSLSSENQAVDEAGTATYSVLKTPDGFLERKINNIVYYIPYYS